MNFLHPGWLALLLILPFILLGAILAFRSQRQVWKKMVAPRLRKQLVTTSSQTRRWIGLALGLCGCALTIAALSRPYVGETTTTEQIASRNIIIAIDTSTSMLVRDGAPDRMSTAKAMAIEVLQAFPEDRVGIIAFSGTAVLMAPLTVDHGAVQETISQLDTDVIPSGGSDLSSAVSTAIEAFQKTGQKTNALIIISDGENHSAATSLAAEKIRKSDTIVCSIGVGTDEGGIIPDNRYRDGKFRDNNGRTVHSKMTPEALDSLARAGQGTYTPATSGSISAISSALSSLKRNEQVGRQTVVPDEYFQWFLIPAIILLILSTVVQSEFLAGRFSTKKKTSIPTTAAKISALILLFTLCLTGSGYTATKLQEAEESYSNGEYEKALKLFTEVLSDSQGEDRRAIEFSIGATAYKLKQWEESNDYLSAALLTENEELQEQAHYNLGNSLFMTGWNQLQTPEPEPKNSPSLQAQDLDLAITSIEDAISHYQAALDISPENINASDNLNEAKKLLEQLQQQQQEQEQEENKSENQEQQEGQGDPKEQEGEGDESKQNSESDQQGEEGQQGENQGQQGDQPNENQQPGEEQGEEESQEQGEQQGEDQKPNQNQQQGQQSQAKNTERREDESEEAHAARILEENSDAETRPVQRRLRRLRRPAKDW